jgi:hypothetical protein
MVTRGPRSSRALDRGKRDILPAEQVELVKDGPDVATSASAPPSMESNTARGGAEVIDVDECVECEGSTHRGSGTTRNVRASPSGVTRPAASRPSRAVYVPGSTIGPSRG